MSSLQSTSACFTLPIADCQLPIYLAAEPLIKSAVGNWQSAIKSASPSDLEKTFEEIRATLLEMVNEERAVEKVPPLVMDELATQVATKHAIDMATAEYASHWGRDGSNPIAVIRLQADLTRRKRMFQRLTIRGPQNPRI